MSTTTIAQVIQCLEQLAPSALQESYDNAGLIVGQKDWPVTQAIVCLDSTEAVVDEAIAIGANLIIAHHPIVFSGLKRLNGSNYIERTIIKAIKHDVAIYAIHTNLDNVAHGVNKVIADKLSLINTRVLRPKRDQLLRLHTYVPQTDFEAVADAVFAAGAGRIGDYSEAGFSYVGQGSFKPEAGANPAIGQVGAREYVQERKLEVVLEPHQQVAVVQAMKAAHPYEEVAYGIIELQQSHPRIGAGMIGDLPQTMDSKAFLQAIKTQLNTACIRYTELCRSNIQRVAVCGGSGSFLLHAAKRAKADIFITADYKYHQFFDADGEIIIADVGHYESEQFTSHLLHKILTENFSTFAVHFSKINTNPVNYL